MRSPGDGGVYARSHVPSDFPSLGTWLWGVREERQVTPTRAAAVMGVTRSTLRRWELGGSRPSLPTLRLFRDRFGIVAQTFRRALRCFASRSGTPLDDTDRVAARLFWALIDARRGSVDESRCLDALLRRYQGFARNAARTFGGKADREELTQVAMIELARVIQQIVPSAGALTWRYANRCCRGKILGHIGDEYYTGLTRGERERIRTVKRYLEDSASYGDPSPPDFEIADALHLPRAAVREAREFLVRRVISLDALHARHTPHSTVDPVDLAILRLDLAAALAHLPGAAALVVTEAFDGEPPGGSDALLTEAYAHLRAHWPR